MAFSGDVAEASNSKARKVALADETGAEIDDANPLPVNINIGISGRTFSYEDTSFVTGDSPVVHDVNTDLSRNAVNGYIVCDGGGDIKIEFSDNGSDWGGQHTLKRGDVINLQGLSIDSIRVTWVTDSAYRILVL